ncbi:MAG: hypothetical protein FJW38_26455 [Acidobacteria bacterium]|nr:hypothetical protein [Acidobacteriota bacterium]
MKNPKQPITNDKPWWPLAVGLALAVLALIEIYRSALYGPFLFDDLYLPFLVPNFATRPLQDWVVGVRPTLQVSYWLNYRMFGQDAFYYHLMNLGLHAAAAYFVWLIAKKLIGFVTENGQWFAAFATAVFVLHPLQTESVGYVASRSEVLSGLFFLIGWAVFLYRAESAIRFPEVARILLFFGLAITSKEHTAVLPAVLLLTDYFFNPGFTLQGIRANWRLYAPILAGAALGVFAVFKFVLGGARTAGFGMKDLTALDYLYTQFRSIVGYLRLFVLPLGQNIDHDVVISRSLADQLSWLCLLILLGLMALAWKTRREYPLAAFGFFLFLVLLAPTSSFVPIRDVLVERRMYMPVFALALCVVDVLRRRRSPQFVIMAAICIVLAAMTWNRNHVWASGVELWKDSVSGSPKKYRPRFQLAYAYYQNGQCAEATAQFNEAAKLEKPNYDLLVDWALAADCANRSAEALTHLEEAVKIEQRAHAYALMGMVHGKQSNFDRALEVLAQAEKLDPRFSITFVYKGNVHMARKEWDLAAEAYGKAVEIEPDEAMGRKGLQQALAAQQKASIRR